MGKEQIEEAASQSMKKKKPWYLRWWAITLGVLLALAVIGQFIDADESQPASATEEEQDPEEGDEGAEGEPASVGVPDVLGMNLAEAQAELEDLDLIVEKYDTVEDRSIIRTSNWAVVEQDPSGGKEVDAETVVNLGVNRPDDEDDEDEKESADDEQPEVTEESEEDTEEPSPFEVEHDSDDLGGAVPGGTTFVRFDIADNFTQGLIASGAQRDTCDALQAGFDAHPDTGRVAVEGSFQTMDDHGNENDSVILRAHYDRDTYGKIDMDNCQIIDVWDLRDGGQIHPDLLGNR